MGEWVDWIEVAQFDVQWGFLVNTIMKFRVA